VGDRNVKAVKEALASYNIRIVAEDTGANYGRTIVFDPVTKDLIIRSAGRSEVVI
jgi:chemotaxis protein CheD